MECGGRFTGCSGARRGFVGFAVESAACALVIRGIKVIMRPLTGFARGPSLPQPADLPGPTVVAGMVAPESPEASRVMSESEQRPGPNPRPLTPAETGAFDDDEPPGLSRRHP